MDNTLTIVRESSRSGLSPPWSDCAGLYSELRLWHLQFGNLTIDLNGRLWRRRAPPAMHLYINYIISFYYNIVVASFAHTPNVMIS